jgi:hypothetical protein
LEGKKKAIMALTRDYFSQMAESTTDTFKPNNTFSTMSDIKPKQATFELTQTDFSK